MARWRSLQSWIIADGDRCSWVVKECDHCRV
jgi:hypothetical protein